MHDSGPSDAMPSSFEATLFKSSAPDTPFNVCDQEPIHIPGSIQPHGLLLVADATTLRIVAGAGDIETRLSSTWLHQPLTGLPGFDAEKAAALDREGALMPLGHVQGTMETFNAVAHRAGGRLVVELEPVDAAAASAADILSMLDNLSGTFERAGSMSALCACAATAFRRLTGFDRVMVYRFLDDDAGEVLAEERSPDLGSFLHHHFPASDIPKQARALYIRNRVRAIPNVGYEPAPLRAAPGEEFTLDMSDAALRSVSPIHLQYLKNMEVAASASVSIVRDGILWGLIACHHRSPKTLSPATRMACCSLAGSLAQQIMAKEEAELYRERLRLRSAEDSVIARLGHGSAVNAFFAEAGEELRRMLGADGFAGVQGKELFATGRHPDEPAIWEMAEWVRKLTEVQPFSTNALAERFPPAHAYRSLASGLMAATLSTEVPTILLWFRAERIEVVNWAGNPHKGVTHDPAAILTPRTSFEAWSETVRGYARPWTLGETEAVRRLTRTLLQVQQNQRIRDLNRELTATNAENDVLLKQKDYLLKEVNHRVKNSLQLVSAFLNMQSRTAKDAALTALLGEAQRRISAVALVHRRLYTDDNVESVDLARYLEELCAEMSASMGEEWGSNLTLNLAPVFISADRAVNVGLVLTELVINANKYAYAGKAGPISVVLEQHRNRFRLIVADNGDGKSQTNEEPRAGQGFGSRMLQAMTSSLGGTFHEESNHPGLRVVLTAPVE